MASKQKGTRNIMLVGKSGSGKRSSGNTILQKEVFEVSSGFHLAKIGRRLQSGTVLGRKLNVMDSPGWSGVDLSPEETDVIFVRDVISMHPGCDAFLYVIRCSAKFTQEEFSAYRRFKKLFGSDVTDHTIVLFAGGDDLKPGTDFKETLKKAPKMLKDVLDDCNWRFVIVNNKTPGNQEQVQQLLDLIDQMCHHNGDQPYVCSSYKTAEPLEIQVRKRLQEMNKQDDKASKYTQEMEQMVLKEIQDMKLSIEMQKREFTATCDHLKEETRRLATEREERLRQEREEQERKHRELETTLQRERERSERQRRAHEIDTRLRRVKAQNPVHKGMFTEVATGLGVSMLGPVVTDYAKDIGQQLASLARDLILKQ